MGLVTALVVVAAGGAVLVATTVSPIPIPFSTLLTLAAAVGAAWFLP